MNSYLTWITHTLGKFGVKEHLWSVVTVSGMIKKKFISLDKYVDQFSEHYYFFLIQKMISSAYLFSCFLRTG